MDQAVATRQTGNVVLFVGTESAYWGLKDYEVASQTARAMGVDSLAVKCADGENRWYRDISQIREQRSTVLSQGCGYIPYTYMYGPKFGNSQIDGEVAILKELMSVSDGIVCGDLEVEWNNQVGGAQHLAQVMSHNSGVFIVTTWADPLVQGWSGVMEALSAVVDVWVPQQYTNWLALQESTLSNLGAHVIQPAIELVSEFGGNNPIDNAVLAKSRGHKTLWIWEYGQARSNPNLVRSCAAIIGKTLTSAQSVNIQQKHPTPTVATPATKSYTIQSGDTLASIAVKLGIANWWQDLYVANLNTLSVVAHQHGQEVSASLIYPGTKLTYKV